MLIFRILYIKFTLIN